MSKVIFVASPEALAKLADGNGQDGVLLENLHIQLQLLYPLADPDMLALCRNPDSRYARDPAGNRCGLTDNEFLDITALGTAWREAWASFPTSIHRVTFDTSLPDPAENQQKIYWHQKMPEYGGIAVIDHDAFRMVAGLATVMSIRSHKTVILDAVKAWPKTARSSSEKSPHDLDEICRKLSKTEDQGDNLKTGGSIGFIG